MLTRGLEGSEMGPSARGGHSLHGGRGIRVPFDGQRPKYFNLKNP